MFKLIIVYDQIGYFPKIINATVLSIFQPTLTTENNSQIKVNHITSTTRISLRNISQGLAIYSCHLCQRNQIYLTNQKQVTNVSH